MIVVILFFVGQMQNLKVGTMRASSLAPVKIINNYEADGKQASFLWEKPWYESYLDWILGN
jgi:hypothetical protein